MVGNQGPAKKKNLPKKLPKTALASALLALANTIAAKTMGDPPTAPVAALEEDRTLSQNPLFPPI